MFCMRLFNALRNRFRHVQPDIEMAGDKAAPASDPIPAILLNTLPKSASVYILETLAATLNKPIITISPGYFPLDLADFRSVNKLIDSRGIAQAHLDASEFNQRHIRKVDKVIVQFRDPRQATLSWFHHLERLAEGSQHDLIGTVNPALPPEYFGLEFKEKLDYQLKIYLPQVVKWISEWTDFVDHCSPSQQIMINTYESFVSQPQKYFDDILNFLGCAPSGNSIAKIEPTKEKNFRLGNPDEWLQVLDEDQRAFADEMIPSALKRRFNWQ